ncbi:hypothetical protein Tco_1248037 [Tanacetum coccineum]
MHPSVSPVSLKLIVDCRTKSHGMCPSLSVLSILYHGIDILGVLLLNCSKLGHPSIDPFEGRRVPINPYSTLLPPVGLRAAVKLSPTSYLDAGNGGSGDNGNGNDVGTGGGKCSDDGGGGSGGEGI